MTDYNASFLRTLAGELAKLDRKTHDSFVAAMRKSDPNFLRRP